MESLDKHLDKEEEALRKELSEEGMVLRHLEVEFRDGSRVKARSFGEVMELIGLDDKIPKRFEFHLIGSISGSSLELTIDLRSSVGIARQDIELYASPDDNNIASGMYVRTKKWFESNEPGVVDRTWGFIVKWWPMPVLPLALAPGLFKPLAISMLFVAPMFMVLYLPQTFEIGKGKVVLKRWRLYRTVVLWLIMALLVSPLISLVAKYIFQ